MNANSNDSTTKQNKQNINNIDVLTQFSDDNDEVAPENKTNNNEIETSIMNVDKIDMKQNIDMDTSEALSNSTPINKGDDDSYESYERKVEMNRGYELSYDTMDDYNIDSDASSDSSIFENKKNRKMEPLYIGDIIKYIEPITGIVESVDRKHRVI